MASDLRVSVEERNRSFVPETTGERTGIEEGLIADMAEYLLNNLRR